MPRISFRLSEATASAYLPDGSRPNQIQTELQLELREATLVEVGIKLNVLPAGIRPVAGIKHAKSSPPIGP